MLRRRRLVMEFLLRDNLQDHNFEHEVSLVYFKFIFQDRDESHPHPCLHHQTQIPFVNFAV